MKCIISITLAMLLSPFLWANETADQVLDTMVDLQESVESSVTPQNRGCLKNLEVTDCEIVPTYGFEALEEGKLTPFWGYEFVGADLAKEFMRSINEENKVKFVTSERVNLLELPRESLTPNLQGELSQYENYQYGSHGTRTNNIILGAGAMGVTDNALLAGTYIFDKQYSEEAQNMAYTISAKNLLEEGVKIYGASETVFKDNIGYLNDLKAGGAILVRSAGNRFPIKGIEQDLPEVTINVGQLSPFGVPSMSSSEGPEVTILAPGRNYSFARGKPKVFGGTSGAQPVVTGCLANVAAILPDITHEESETLLIKTAIPTLNSRDKGEKQLNGVGTLNCYKLARVAQKLKENWPESRRLIDHDSIYDFSKEIAKLKAEEIVGDCPQTTRLKQLREVFLLNPHDLIIADEIESLYLKNGYPLNAQLYSSLKGYSEEQIVLLGKEFRDSDRFSGDILRYGVQHFNRPAELVRNHMYAADEGDVMYAAMNSQGIVEPEIVRAELLKIVERGDVDGYNFEDFERAYFGNGFELKDFLEVCESKLPEWEQDEYSQPRYTCYSFFKQDTEISLDFIVKQLQRNEEKADELILRKYGEFNWLSEEDILFANELLSNLTSKGIRPDVVKLISDKIESQMN